jgi:hypothetical protein
MEFIFHEKRPSRSARCTAAVRQRSIWTRVGRADGVKLDAKR